MPRVITGHVFVARGEGKRARVEWVARGSSKRKWHDTMHYLLSDRIASGTLPEATEHPPSPFVRGAGTNEHVTHTHVAMVLAMRRDGAAGRESVSGDREARRLAVAHWCPEVL